MNFDDFIRDANLLPLLGEARRASPLLDQVHARKLLYEFIDYSDFNDLIAADTGPDDFSLITIDPKGGLGGRSQKARNIFLSWKRAFKLIPDVGLAAWGAATLPVLAHVLAALYVWQKVSEASVEILTVNEAATALAVWNLGGGMVGVDESRAQIEANSLLLRENHPELTTERFSASVDRLVRIGSFELRDGLIHMEESFKIASL
jgi:hypothetical protein